MQITIIVIITNGRAKSKAGIKSHATMYQYEFIGAIMEYQMVFDLHMQDISLDKSFCTNS